MKTFGVALILAFAIFSASADQDLSKFIVNGEDASIKDFPFLAKVWNLNWAACGGAIISTRSVLTVKINLSLNDYRLIKSFQAAHCFVLINGRATGVSIVVGSSRRRGEGGTRYQSLRTFIHPGYVSGPLLNDVAVVRTVSRIIYGELVQPIAMSSAFVGAAVEGVFAGWGADSYGLMPRRADLLQRMDFRTISNEQCREMYSVTHRGQFVVDQKLCILSGPRTSVCSGDSGTPLVVNGAVVGVTSWRTMPCGDGLPDVFIRVATVRPWIISVI